MEKENVVQGTKNDLGKDRWDLAPWDAIRLVIKVLNFGALKYQDRNWEKGINYSRIFGAVQRHLTAWWGGEDRDPESGILHLAHAACGILFLIAFKVRGMDAYDDRPVYENKEAGDEQISEEVFQFTKEEAKEILAERVERLYQTELGTDRKKRA